MLRQVLAIHFPHAVSPVMLRYLQHPALAEVLGLATAAHLPHWDGRVKGFHVAEIDSRRVVPITGDDPYAWKGYESEPDAVYIRHRDRARVQPA